MQDPLCRWVLAFGVAFGTVPWTALCAQAQVQTVIESRVAVDPTHAGQAVCIEPVLDDDGQPDPELMRALHTALPLVVRHANHWQLDGQCSGAVPRVQIRGHRDPNLRYAIVVTLPDGSERSLVMDAHVGAGPFVLAEALCVNVLLLLGEPIRPRADPGLSQWLLWVAPAATFGNGVRVVGTEIGLRWVSRTGFWLGGNAGFEAFGSGSNGLGQYQYSVAQVGLFGGWIWRMDGYALSLGFGLREHNWFSHLQTTGLSNHYDVGIAAAGEVRGSVRVSGPLRLALAVRPSWGLREVEFSDAGGPVVFSLPRFLMQVLVQVAVEL